MHSEVAFPLLAFLACRAMYSGDRGFDVNVESTRKDKEILERARTAYKAAASNTKSAFLVYFAHGVALYC